ncbi:MAG: glycosyltransferase family 39 protein, partial [Candidatus Eisenbacteria bacterium]
YVAAGAFLLLYLLVALQRIAYPWELEWMEGGLVDHVQRIVNGQGIYVSPSLDFIPYAYAPLYAYLSAGVAQLIGVGFVAPRLVSLAASLAACGLIFLWVRRETGRASAGLIAAALFAAMYRLAGTWFDIARCDSLFLALLLASLYLLRFGRSLATALCAGLLGLLAFLAKQAALPILVPLLALACLTDRRRGLPAAMLFVAGLLASSWIFDALTDGWYGYYVFDLPRQRWLATPRIGKLIGFWSADLIGALSLTASAAVLYLLRVVHEWDRGSLRGDAPARAAFYWLFTAAMIGAAWISRAESGGHANVLLPAFAALAVLGGLGFHTAACLLEPPTPDQIQPPDQTRSPHQAQSPGTTARTAGFERQWIDLALSCAILLQFAVLAYNPRWIIPTAEDRRTGEECVAALAGLPGEVWMPYHGHLPSLAGKSMRAHLMAIADIMASTGVVKSRLRAEIAGALEEHRFQAIVLDEDLWFFEDELEQSYGLKQPFLPDSPGFYPLAGMRVRPRWLYETPSATPEESFAAGSAADHAARLANRASIASRRRSNSLPSEL